LYGLLFGLHPARFPVAGFISSISYRYRVSMPSAREAAQAEALARQSVENRSLFAERHSERQQRRQGRTMMCPDHLWLPTHLSPDPKGGGIHKEQTELIAVFASLAVDADRGQKLCLAGANQVWSHTKSGCIPDFQHLRRTLGNGLVMQQPPCVIPIKTEQQIV
jgi:hypothetical protein